VTRPATLLGPDRAPWAARRRRARARVGLLVAAGSVLAVLVLASSPAGATSGVQVGVVVNGQPAATSSDARPAQIHPNRPTELSIKVLNQTDTTLQLSTVRLEGKVLALPLFSYDSLVDLVVPPGGLRSETIPVNMNGVGGLATGLVVATVTVIDSNGYAVGSQSIVVKIYGSLASVYGFFALAVLVLTISSLVLALILLVRHRLPENRWLRAVRFFVPGFGVGLILTFTLAASGLFAPGPGHWLALLAVPSAIGLAAGFLTPAPDEDEYDDYDENVLLAEIVMVDEDPLQAQDRVLVTGGPGPAPGTMLGGDGRSTVMP
jgi:hypothetical protein